MCEDFLKLEFKDWKEIQEIKKLYNCDLIKSKKLLFIKTEDDDIEKVLKYNNDSHHEEFNITGKNYILIQV